MTESMSSHQMHHLFGQILGVVTGAFKGLCNQENLETVAVALARNALQVPPENCMTRLFYILILL